MQDTYDELEVIEDNEETIAEAAAEDEGAGEIEEIEETEAEEIEEDKKDLEGLYEALDKLTDFVTDRFDKISALLIDSGAVIQDHIDEAYDRTDLIEDSMGDLLEDLDYSI